MKKLIMGVCALMAVAAVSCGKCGDGSCDKAANDSLSATYGDYVGSVLGNDYNNRGVDRAKKEDFLRGMQLVFGAENGEDFAMGMQVASQMLAEMNQLKEQGAVVDRAKVMDSFKKAFLADSIDSFHINIAMQEMHRFIAEARERSAQEAAKAKAESPEAVNNVKAGNDYVADLKNKGVDVKTTESGLSYTIEAEGEGDKPAATSSVVVNYTGKHLDGRVFDSTEGRNPADFNLQGVVPGFREGIMLLGKGGKATLYIPGELAYGTNGQPAAGIGPNEMLVFEVEVLDIQD